MSLELVCTGIGGRGVLLASSILMETAVARGVKAIASDELGMSQRGGSVISMIKVGNSRSPLVGRERADALLAFEESEFYRALPFLKRHGLAVVNSRKKETPPSVAALIRERGIRYFAVDADRIATGRGMPQASNMALLGFFSRFSLGPYSLENIIHAVRARVPERLFEKNREVLEAGWQQGEGRS